MNVPEIYNDARVNREYNRATVTDIVVPEGITRIADWTFSYCRKLVSISLPNSLTSIGMFAFYHCTSLRHITIPPSVTSIREGAFYQCYALSSVHLPPTAAIIYDNHPFWECTILDNLANAKIYQHSITSACNTQSRSPESIFVSLSNSADQFSIGDILIKLYQSQLIAVELFTMS